VFAIVDSSTFSGLPPASTKPESKIWIQTNAEKLLNNLFEWFEGKIQLPAEAVPTAPGETPAPTQEVSQSDAESAISAAQQAIDVARASGADLTDAEDKLNEAKASLGTDNAAAKAAAEEVQGLIDEAIATFKDDVTTLIQDSKDALKEAKDAGALDYAKDIYKEAEDHIAQAESAFATGDYANAKKHADLALETAKKAKETGAANKAAAEKRKNYIVWAVVLVLVIALIFVGRKYMSKEEKL